MGNVYNVTLLLLCLLSICLIHFVYTTDGGCIDQERQALMKFKEGLVHKENRLSSWTPEDCCTWDGIICNNFTGHVQRIDLHNPIQPYVDRYSKFDNFAYYSNNCLGGEIDPSICDLKYLRYLDLSSNNFSGIQIPTCFGSLKNLRYLNLSGAGFSGEIPPSLGNLSHLQYLYIGESYYGWSDNHLTAKSLKWISGLPYLKALDLSTTNLNESLDWFYSINMIPSLSSLSLRKCKLDGIVSSPISLVNLTSLTSLDLGENDMNPNLPFWLFNLSSHLEILRLDHNNLEYPITSILEKLTTLTLLDLSKNSFNSLSMLDSMCNCTSLVSVDFGYNQFEGSLPLCLGNLTSLRVLNIERNKFSGKIPSKLGYLKQLTYLDLSSNYFNSCIPSIFGQLRKLKFLYLHHNQFNAIIPPTLWQLTELEELDISQNSLTGELSESHFVKLKSLKLLSISENQFRVLNVSSHWIPKFQLQCIQMDSVYIGGHFPSWLRTQKNVVRLSMANASIFGAIPEWFGTICSSVKHLDLSYNFLTGAIPEWFGTICSSVKYLDLSSNKIHGSSNDNVLYSLCNLSSLGVLNLANNKLTGRIPWCFGNLQQLSVLNLANNSLSGHIPSTLGNLVRLYFLHLNINKFYGVLPSSLKNLKLLKTLDLGENHLTDTIPDWIGKEFSRLMFLRIESNKFYGNISLCLCQLSSLQILNLAHNNLVGNIPHCLGNLSMMLSSNRGSISYFSSYTDELWNTMKGREREYSSNLLPYAKFISLSGNHLYGEIPNELMDLEGLQSLNLSNNNLSGKIPVKIGNLKQLESMDLSMNQLSGPIPPSLANIDALSYLNLSFNNLAGCIPSGNHFDTLTDPSIYEGNSGLFGRPLATSCPDNLRPKENGATSDKRIDDDNEFEFLWFYAGIGPGFVVGLFGVLYVLHFKKSWRHTYFGLLENIYSKLASFSCQESSVPKEIHLSI